MEIPQTIKGLLETSDWQKLRQLLRDLRSRELILDWDERFNRFAFRGMPQLLDLQASMALRVSTLIERNVEATFHYISWYGKNGVCPSHKDTPECEYVLNYCVEQREEWPFYVSGRPYKIEENGALLYRGEWEHERKQRKEQESEIVLIAFCFKGLS